jgi:hypothetical protein
MEGSESIAMDPADEHQDGDGPPGRSTSGSPVVAPERRVRDSLISFSPAIAAWIAGMIGENSPDGPVQ